MEPGVAPEWVVEYLPVFLWAAAAVGAIWLVLTILDYLNRRAYNLTVSDRGGDPGETPGFLKVDHEKRAAAQRAGEAFDEKIKARDAAEAAAADAATSGGAARQALSLARLGTIALAIISVATAAIGAIGRIEYYDEAARRLTSWERLTEIISTYWLGFVVVAALLAIQIYQAIRQVRAG